MSDRRPIAILILALAVPTPGAAQTAEIAVDREVGQPPLIDVGLDRFPNSFHAFFVAFRARQTAFSGPATIAIHDDSNMLRHLEVFDLLAGCWFGNCP